jgi:type IV secretion system protein VirB2
MLFNLRSELLAKCLLMFAIILTFFPEVAAAADATKIQGILCNVTKEISGGTGKAIAILIVISMAIGLFVGKITWGVAIAVAVGMGILFGAEGIVKIISGDSTAICDTATQ